jgi:hypothetical protein
MLPCFFPSAANPTPVLGILLWHLLFFDPRGHSWRHQSSVEGSIPLLVSRVHLRILTPAVQTFGWNTLINVFYLPGAILGSFVSDWIGPRKALGYGVLAQGIVGFIMAGCYAQLATPAHIGGFVVVYG